MAVEVISSGSTTETETITRPADGRLVLRGDQGPRRQVRWTEDVVDNEHMNKKKSKSK
jgi:hypothetical protein